MPAATSNNSVRECPYCSYTYQPESETYSEDVRVETCSSCDKQYHASESFSVTHHALPDCLLNGEEHDWQEVELRGGRMHPFCSKCNECMSHSDAEVRAAGLTKDAS